jgi:hypothetical protein
MYYSAKFSTQQLQTRADKFHMRYMSNLICPVNDSSSMRPHSSHGTGAGAVPSLVDAGRTRFFDVILEILLQFYRLR